MNQNIVRCQNYYAFFSSYARCPVITISLYCYRFVIFTLVPIFVALGISVREKPSRVGVLDVNSFRVLVLKNFWVIIVHAVIDRFANQKVLPNKPEGIAQNKILKKPKLPEAITCTCQLAFRTRQASLQQIRPGKT